jgi:hypothetical protein
MFHNAAQRARNGQKQVTQVARASRCKLGTDTANTGNSFIPKEWDNLRIRELGQRKSNQQYPLPLPELL